MASRIATRDVVFTCNFELLVIGRIEFYQHVIGLKKNVTCNRVERGCTFTAPFGKKTNQFLELPFRAGFCTIVGRAVDMGEKGWRTADAVHLYSHYPAGLGEADTQRLPMSIFVGAMSRNR